MSDNMNLVEHVRRNKNGLTKMQIQIPISTRAGMAELSKRLGISQLAIVRVSPGSLPGRQRGTGGPTGRPRGDRRGPG